MVDTQSMQKEGYEREERIHKSNQTLKTQLEQQSLQKEKL